jgi:hypothetical protein
VEEDEEALKKELKEAFRIYDKVFSIEIYKWRKDTASADVFVCVFTSAYNRDVAANFCNKTLAPFPPSHNSSIPPPSLCPSTLWKM